MKNIKVQNPQELFSYLYQLNLNVPQRTKGRKTQHTEDWPMSRFLSTYASSDLLRFPLEIIHQDKPDFKIIQPHEEIGIEITESIPEDYSYIFALAEKNSPKSNIEPSMFTRGTPKRSKKELLEILERSQEQLIGLPIGVDKIEQDWSEWIFEDISSKTQKLNSGLYKIYKKNFLLIYDNLPHVINDEEVQLDYLKPKVNDYWQSEKYNIKFESIFIMSVYNIIEISQSSIRSVEVVNLWD